MKKNVLENTSKKRLSRYINKIIKYIPRKNLNYEKVYGKKNFQNFKENIEQMTMDIHTGVTELCEIYDFQPDKIDSSYCRDKNGCWIKDTENKVKVSEKQVQKKESEKPNKADDTSILSSIKKLEYYVSFNTIPMEEKIRSICKAGKDTQAILDEKGLKYYENQGELEYRLEQLSNMVGKYIKIMKYHDFVDKNHNEILLQNLDLYTKNTLQFITDINKELVENDIKDLNTTIRASLITEDKEYQFYHEGEIE